MTCCKPEGAAPGGRPGIDGGANCEVASALEYPDDPLGSAVKRGSCCGCCCCCCSVGIKAGELDALDMEEEASEEKEFLLPVFIDFLLILAVELDTVNF